MSSQSRELEDSIPRYLSGQVTRRQFVARLAAAGVAFPTITAILAACAAPAARSSAPPATAAASVPPSTAVALSGTLTVVSESAADVDPFTKLLINGFKAKYPGVTIVQRTVSGGGTSGTWSEYAEAILAQVAGGQVPDTTAMATEALRPFIAAGLLRPIDDLVSRDQLDLASYFGQVPDGVVKRWTDITSPDGTTYCLPGYFNTMGIWLNKKVFASAGVDVPDDNWTWDDFHTIATKLTRPGQTFGMALNTGYFTGVMPWLLTNGASSLDEHWTKATIGTPEAIEAAAFMRQLVAEGISPEPGGQFDQFQAMADGKLAMFGAGWWPLSTMTGLDMIDQLKIVAWPKKRQQGSPVGWTVYPIFKASEQTETAWAWIKYTQTSKEAENFAGIAGPALPLRADAAREAAIPKGPEGSQALYDALKYATPIPSPANLPTMQRDLEDTFTQILAGNVDPATALPALSARIDAIL